MISHIWLFWICTWWNVPYCTKWGVLLQESIFAFSWWMSLMLSRRIQRVILEAGFESEMDSKCSTILYFTELRFTEHLSRIVSKLQCKLLVWINMVCINYCVVLLFAVPPKRPTIITKEGQLTTSSTLSPLMAGQSLSLSCESSGGIYTSIRYKCSLSRLEGPL